MTIVLAILKKFWPWILGGAVVLGLLFTIWIKDKKIDSLGKDVKICQGELATANDAFKREKFAYITVNKELKKCHKGEAAAQDDYRDLYEWCLDSMDAVKKTAEAICSDQEECVCVEGEKQTFENMYRQYNLMGENWRSKSKSSL